ncbi:MAG: fibronectin type III domain-containing protein [Paludibacteraceae bacterium]|nr:fibronectin type III domain-containing protein [Paludibacteraceae bacterium]
MRKLYSILALCAFLFLSVGSRAADYTIEPKADDAAPIKSRAIPLRFDNGATWGSVSQQIYLASELIAEGAGAGDIEAISFYYGAVTSPVNAQSRPIQIFIMQVPSEGASKIDSFVVKPANAKSDFLYVSNTNKTAGTRVYEGALATEAVNISDIKKVKINFDNSFTWDGSSNIVLTVFDMSPTSNTISSTGYTNLRFMISKTDHPRFLSKKWMSTDTDDRATKNTGWIDDISNNLTGREGEYWTASAAATVPVQSANRSYVNKVDFSITTTPAPSTPTGLAANDISTTSASISWNTASSASSYELQSSTNGEDWSVLASSISGTSYSWTGLTASTTYYVRVRAVNAVGNSDWSEPLSFTTLAPHIHDGITFEPWSNPAALPTSGNYFLNTDVELASDWNVTENINLCLNGHEVYTETNSIQVKDGATFAIYDNEGGGRIYGYFVANYPEYGLINIENGGTLVLSEGTIQNLYGSYEEDDDPDDKSLSNAIYNNGTLKLSGALTFTSYHADIYLGSNKYITIESEKPLTNSEPYSVYKSGKSVITSGWANMNGADPKDYFMSANTSLNIKMGETEAEFYPVISLSENNTNTAIGTYSGQTIDVNLTRSLTSSQYNTFCLPFALSNAQLEEVFGVGYDLEELIGSSLAGDELTLSFEQVTSLEAGKPYLLQPSVEVTNPSFEGVTIGATAPDDQTSDANISFHGTFAPTELAGGNKNLLFLGAGNELFWPDATGNLKAFRAYFEVKGAARAAVRAKIVKKEDQTQAIDLVENPNTAHKRIIDGQLVIEKNGMLFNAQGQMVK